jgi:hypothetical protein
VRLLFRDDQTLHTDLSRDQVLAVMRDATEKRTLWGILFVRSKATFFGEVGSETFKVERRSISSNSRLHLHGQLHSEPGGTRVELRIRLTLAIEVYNWCWLGFSALMAILFPFQAVPRGRSDWGRLLGVALFVGGYAFMKTFFEVERWKVLRALRRVLGIPNSLHIS